MVWAYCRISTRNQLAGNSLEEQKNAITSIYPDCTVIEEVESGAGNRPLFNNMIDQIKSGDILVVTKMDRFCRSTKQGLDYIDQIRNKGAAIHILNMGLIDNSQVGKLLVTFLLAFADYERSVIMERMASGKAIAKKNPNYKDGRPKKYSPDKMNLAIDLLKTHSYRQTSDLTGISVSTLTREVRRRRLLNKL